jgi:hypothetical protein
MQSPHMPLAAHFPGVPKAAAFFVRKKQANHEAKAQSFKTALNFNEMGESEPRLV